MERILVKDISSPELIDKLNKGGLTFYIGTDPTADSLHIGHFSSFLICKKIERSRTSSNTFSRWCDWSYWRSSSY